MIVAATFIFGAVCGAWCYRSYRNRTVSPSVDLTPRPSPTDAARHEGLTRVARSEGCNVLFVGDSLTDFWRDYPDVWEQHFGEMKPLNFGVAGDRVCNLEWRLQSGEFDGLHPKVIVMLIGTNDLPMLNGGQVASRILEIASEFHDRLKSEVIILGLFPRHDSPDVQLQVAACNEALLRSGATPLDLGEKLGGDAIGVDGIHLTAKGYAAWGEALAPILREKLRR